MRRCLRALAGAWLACQIVAVASPLTLFSDALGIDQASCCPGVAPGEMCPMHHKAAGDRTTCKMESACGHHDAALLTILAVGVLPAMPSGAAPTLPIEFISSRRTDARSRIVHPDLPPPKRLL